MTDAALGQIEMFFCERRDMRLTRPGCARLWQGAIDKPPQPYEGRAACVSCAVGAANAGKTVPKMQEAIAAIKRCCPRCLNLSPRLINGRFCISCYNRHCEAMKGRNARGGRPRLCDVLHSQVFGVAHGGAVSRAVEQGVTSTVEAILLMSLRAKESMAFGAPKIQAWLGAAVPQQEFAI